MDGKEGEGEEEEGGGLFYMPRSHLMAHAEG